MGGARGFLSARGIIHSSKLYFHYLGVMSSLPCPEGSLHSPSGVPLRITSLFSYTRQKTPNSNGVTKGSHIQDQRFTLGLEQWLPDH